jgi:hypothetical protein
LLDKENWWKGSKNGSPGGKNCWREVKNSSLDAEIHPTGKENG